MHPEIDRFAHLESPIHRWDPRLKLAALLLLMLLLGIERAGARSEPSLTADLPPALAGLVLSAGLIALSRIPWSHVLRKLRGPAVILGVISIIFPLTYPGERVRFGFLSVSPAGLIAALLIAVRALSIVLLVFPAFGTTRFDVTVKALRSLRVPAPLVQTILFTYRYLFVYSDQLRKMRTALRARGFHPRMDVRTMRALGNGLGVLLVGSIERTERIHDAMRCRGFSGVFHALDPPRARPRDVLMSAGVLAAGAGILAWKLS